jgi:hypothetical protein
MAGTFDGWTSAATDGYATLTGHYIDPAWKLRRVLLGLKELPGGL